MNVYLDGSPEALCQYSMKKQTENDLSNCNKMYFRLGPVTKTGSVYDNFVHGIP